MMTWGGNVLRVMVQQGPGTWKTAGAIHEVYAIRDSGTGVISLLVADDAAKLQWVNAEHCTVQAAPLTRG